MKEKLNKNIPLKYIDVRQIKLEEKGKYVDENIEFVIPVKSEEEDLDEASDEKEKGTDEEESEDSEDQESEEEDIEEK
jgi:hypothetical protein